MAALTWYRDWEIWETVVAAGFLVGYLLYLFRLIRIARHLPTHWGRVVFKGLLRTLIFALLFIALLGPVAGNASREVRSVGKDIMICVDLSRSMDAIDIAPTRMEKLKFELKKLVSAFSSDRIGIIIFSGEAFLQSPMTYDQNALHLMIDAIQTSLVPASGTDFGPPLQMALDKLTDDTEGPTGRNKSKVILLISDGEDFGEQTSKAVAAITREDIRLFTLGIGTRAGGNIRQNNGYKRDNAGKIVVTQLKPESLQQLARDTGGRYFEISESRNDLARLIAGINTIEGELRETRSIDVSANRYLLPLGLALLLLALDIFVPLKMIEL